MTKRIPRQACPHKHKGRTNWSISFQWHVGCEARTQMIMALGALTHDTSARAAIGEHLCPVWMALWMFIKLLWGCCLFPNNKIVSWSFPPLHMRVRNVNINEIKWCTLQQNFICRFYFLLRGTLMSVLRSLLHLKCLFKNLISSAYSINVL